MAGAVHNEALSYGMTWQGKRRRFSGYAVDGMTRRPTTKLWKLPLLAKQSARCRFCNSSVVRDVTVDPCSVRSPGCCRDDPTRDLHDRDEHCSSRPIGISKSRDTVVEENDGIVR